MNRAERRMRRFLGGVAVLIMAAIIVVSVRLWIELGGLRDALRTQADAWSALADLTAKREAR